MYVPGNYDENDEDHVSGLPRVVVHGNNDEQDNDDERHGKRKAVEQSRDEAKALVKQFQSRTNRKKSGGQ